MTSQIEQYPGVPVVTLTYDGTGRNINEKIRPSSKYPPQPLSFEGINSKGLRAAGQSILINNRHHMFAVQGDRAAAARSFCRSNEIYGALKKNLLRQVSQHLSLNDSIPLPGIRACNKGYFVL